MALLVLLLVFFNVVLFLRSPKECGGQAESRGVGLGCCGQERFRDVVVFIELWNADVNEPHQRLVFDVRNVDLETSEISRYYQSGNARIFWYNRTLHLEIDARSFQQMESTALL